MSGWRRMLGDWALVGSTTLVCHGLGTATSLLLRVLLSPAQMGIWQALKLLLSYGNYANLGISKGAVREYNVALGSGDTQAARRGLDLAFTINTLSSLLYAAVLVGAGLWIGATSANAWAGRWALGLAVAGVLAVVSRHVTFRVTILRASQSFGVTSQLAALDAGLTLVVCGTTTWLWGLPGLYAGTLTVLLVSMVFVQRRAATALRWAWNAPEIRRLVGIGAPILLAGAIETLFRSLDRLMILAYLSDREYQLGCYSVTLLVTAQLFGLGNMLATVIGPRYGEKYGQSNDRRAVARLAARASELSAAAIALPAALALVAAPPFLARLLPDYQAGLAPLRWLAPGAVLLTLALSGSQWLIAVGMQRRALAAVLLATGVAALGNHLALSGAWGLAGVASATAAGYGVYYVLAVGTSFWIELDLRGRLRYVVMHALALGPTLGAALWLQRDGTSVPDWTAVAAQSLAVAAVWAACVAVGWRCGGWRGELRRE